MSSAFLEAVKARRTYYGLSKASSIPDKQIKEILDRAVTHVPSAFNSQSAGLVLLTGRSHESLWQTVWEGMLKVVGDNKAEIETTTTKIAEHAAGYGTVLFFEDQAVINGFRARIAPLAPHFNAWSENSAGMLQFAVWTALTAEGLGASLQHHGSYSSELHAHVLKEFDLPSTWKNMAMMPFGIPTAPPGHAARPKTFEPIDGRVKVFLSPPRVVHHVVHPSTSAPIEGRHRASASHPRNGAQSHTSASVEVADSISTGPPAYSAHPKPFGQIVKAFTGRYGK